MLLWILLIFILVPLIEVAIFIGAGHTIGVLQTIVLILISGIIGAFLVRTQGAQVIYNIKRSVEQGLLPSNELIDGLFVLIGGALLLTPGFFTDLIGLVMLLPPTRRVLREFGKEYLRRRFKSYIVRIDID
ncbi:MAG TPA: FxsA family protein [Anaerolineae bacterium]|nr:FxsA family protein [Anaerolineae bacterium]